LKTLYVEFLFGHDTGLKESYNRAQEDELLQEYMKVIPELTVLGNTRIQKETSSSQSNLNHNHEAEGDSQRLHERMDMLEQIQLRLTAAEESNTKMLGELLQMLKPQSMK
ncbi:MAG: hypothetical protein JRN20_22705, partial [Nitrososphaerota archaeon]|nr:hypothetical protein [Nitrososphaerota archaeon]